MPDLSFADQQVGKIAARSNGFPDYVFRALKKIGREARLTEADLAGCYTRHEDLYWKKLAAYYQFRALFAPAVEAVVLLDRCLWLLESKKAKFTLRINLIQRAALLTK